MLYSPAGFRAGANLPWIHYGCDFGANAWQPNGGLGASGVPDEVKRVLGRLAERQATLVRWFLFCDGRAGIRFEGDRATGLDESILADVDVALTLASALGLDVVFTLFDFNWCHPCRLVNGVQLGGRTASFADDELRQSLLEQVIAPLFRGVGMHPRIAAWDVINEPEWVTGGVRRFRPWSRIGREPMRRLIADVTTLAHRTSAHPVTVGSASARWLPLVGGLGLDFYQVHWYDKVEGGRPPETLAVSSLDRPVMLGEFPTRRSARSTETFLRVAENAGYFAALPWSVLAEDDYSCGGDALCRAMVTNVGTDAAPVPSAGPIAITGASTR